MTIFFQSQAYLSSKKEWIRIVRLNFDDVPDIEPRQHARLWEDEAVRQGFHSQKDPVQVLREAGQGHLLQGLGDAEAAAGAQVSVHHQGAAAWCESLPQPLALLAVCERGQDPARARSQDGIKGVKERDSGWEHC